MALALVVVLALLLCVSRRELARLERLLADRDRTIAATVAALANERAARVALQSDPRVLLRAHVNAQHPPRFT
jgi:hypothetical protein